MENDKNKLRELAIDFALEISDMCDGLTGVTAYVNQIIRSSSSIGANIFEARYAQGKADFISKLEIALKECYETEYWLELLYRKNKISDETYKLELGNCGKLRIMLISSIKTVKNK